MTFSFFFFDTVYFERAHRRNGASTFAGKKRSKMHLISPSKRRDIVWELVTAIYGPLPKIQNAVFRSVHFVDST